MLPTESVMMCLFGSTDFLNVARKDLLASIVSASGLAVPVTLPLHPLNSHPAAGFAVTVTVLPAGYVFVCGSMLSKPLPVTVESSVNDAGVTPPMTYCARLCSLPLNQSRSTLCPSMPGTVPLSVYCQNAHEPHPPVFGWAAAA